MSIAIIGAGITGITTAYYLEQAGHKVVIYDKQHAVATECSHQNGGQLSVSNAEVWNSIPTVIKGLKWMRQTDAPLYINPSWSLPKFKWISKFLFHTLVGNHSSTVKTIEYGLAARDLYYQIADQENINFHLLKEGILHFYRKPASIKSAQKTCKMFQKNGVNRYMVSKEEIMEIEPTLEAARDSIVGGTFTPDDASGDARLFCEELLKKMLQRGNVTICYEQSITGISAKSSHATLQNHNGENFVHDYVIICAGADSEALANQIQDSVGVYPIKGYSISVPLYDEELAHAPYVSLLDEENKIVSSRLGDHLRVAGTAELADWNMVTRSNRIKPLVTWTKELFPKVDSRYREEFACLRPMTPNMFPVVRPSKHHKRVVFNTGHGHLGWTMGAYTGYLTAGIIEDLMKK